MKKTALLIIAMVVLLASCSVQENVCPETFIKKLDKFGDFLCLDELQPVFTEDGCLLFVDNISGEKFLIDMQTNENNDIVSIGLTADGNISEDSFFRMIAVIIETYSPDEDIDEVVNGLYGENRCEKYTYYDSHRHRFYGDIGKEAMWFSVQNSTLIVTERPELTLKENDRTTDKTK